MSGSEIGGIGDQARIRVVIVDDHDLFRSGLGELLSERGFEIVGEAGDGEQGVGLVRNTVPDVVLMDMTMPRLSGIEATRELRHAGVASRVVMLTISADEEDLIEAVLAGASGYLLKDANLPEIANAIRVAAHGESYISSRAASRLFERMRDAGSLGRLEVVERPTLSRRESEVLRLLTAGRDNAEIASELHLSPHTVKGYVSRLIGKLGAENRVEAAVHAVRRGLV